MGLRRRSERIRCKGALGGLHTTPETQHVDKVLRRAKNLPHQHHWRDWYLTEFGAMMQRCTKSGCWAYRLQQEDQ